MAIGEESEHEGDKSSKTENKPADGKHDDKPADGKHDDKPNPSHADAKHKNPSSQSTQGHDEHSKEEAGTKPGDKESKSDDTSKKPAANAPTDTKPGSQDKTQPAPDRQQPTIAISQAHNAPVVDAQASDANLLKSAVQKARRLSIRAKSRSSILSQSLLTRPSSGTPIPTANVDVTADVEADNVWELAVKMKQVSRELADPDTAQLETTLIVVGGKQAGKSTLIGRLLGGDVAAARRTLGLDYTYARRSGGGISKDVCQIWELGGGTSFLGLLDTPVRADRLADTACVVVVDLSRPDTILPTVRDCCAYVHQLIDTKLREAGATGVLVRGLLAGQLQARRPQGHPDAKAVQPLLIPLALVGGMYDKFQPMDTVDKKVVVEAMRWLAHKYFAYLLFFSSMDVALQNRATDLLSHFAFHTEPNERQSLDVQKPLQVRPGVDSFKAITGGSDAMPYEVVLSHVSQKWPPAKEKTGVPDDPSKDAVFAEPEVDSLRAEKAKELDRLRQDLERRRKMAQERDAAAKLKSKAPTQVGREAAAAAAAELIQRHHGNTNSPRTDTKKPAANNPGHKKPEAKKPGPETAAHHDGKGTTHSSDNKNTEEKNAHPKSTHDTKEEAPAKKPADAHQKPAAKAEEKSPSKKPAAKAEEKSPSKKPTEDHPKSAGKREQAHTNEKQSAKKEDKPMDNTHAVKK